MTPEQAAELLELLENHLSWPGLWAGYGIGISLSGSLLIWRAARKAVEDIDE